MWIFSSWIAWIKPKLCFRELARSPFDAKRPECRGSLSQWPSSSPGVEWTALNARWRHSRPHFRFPSATSYPLLYPVDPKSLMNRRTLVHSELIRCAWMNFLQPPLYVRKVYCWFRYLICMFVLVLIHTYIYMKIVSLISGNISIFAVSLLARNYHDLSRDVSVWKKIIITQKAIEKLLRKVQENYRNKNYWNTTVFFY